MFMHPKKEMGEMERNTDIMATDEDESAGCGKCVITACVEMERGEHCCTATSVKRPPRDKAAV
jgi:hypothetical protein